MFFVACFPIFEGPIEIAWCGGVRVLPIVFFIRFIYLPWYSFVFFLVLLGGLLILFLYVSGLVPTVNYEFWFIIVLSLQLSFVVIFIFIYFFVYRGGFSFLDSAINRDFFNIFDNYFYLFNLFIIFYLLVGLLIVGFLIDISEGPIRKLII